MIAGAGALWLGLLMVAAGEPPTMTAPATTTPLGGAPSTSSIVAVRRPPPGDTVLEEAGSRIRSELSAMGLEGQFVDCPPIPAGDRAACPNITAPATISLTRDDGVVEIGVRTFLPDGLELGRHVRVLASDGGDDPSVLAVRAVELLRDLRLTARRPAPPRPVGPARDDEEPKLPPPPVPPRWHLSAGVALLSSPRGDQPGVGPAFAPAIAAGAVVGTSLSIVASLAGPFNASLGPIDTRTAALLQALATLELRFRITPIGPIEPFTAVLTGVNYLKANIPAPSDRTDGPSNTSAWVPLFGVSFGLTWRFRTRFYVAAEAAAFVTQPNMLVLIDGVVAGGTGAPSLLLTSSAGLTLP